MTDSKKIIQLLNKPLFQAAVMAVLMMLLTGVDYFMPSDDEFFDADAGPWIVSTAMILLFIIVNTVVALRIINILPYWTLSIVSFISLMAFAYGWCFLLTGQHIDDVGSFRWLWIVLGMVYLVFFVITRTMKRIVDIAIEQDKKLRGEE